MDTSYAFISANFPVSIKTFSPPHKNDLDGQPSFKYLDYNEALEHSVDYVSSVLESVSLSGEHANVVVDVKVRDMKEGEYPCRPGWHTDCTLDFRNPTRPEIHHLFVWGAGCQTMFVTSPVVINMNKENRFLEFQEAVEGQADFKRIPECTLVRYGRFNIHAPSKARSAGRRLLIRVTETDLISPTHKIDWDKAFKFVY